MKIIVTDDEYFVRYSLVSMIQELCPDGVCVREAENGEELMRIAFSEKPDVILLDIRMPKLGGLEAFSALREQLPDTQWVIVSGYADFSYAKQALQLGAKDYLMKPVNIEELKRVLERLIQDKDSTRAQKVKSFSYDMGLWLHQAEKIGEFKDNTYFSTVFHSCINGDAPEAGNRKPEDVRYMQELCMELSLPGDTVHGLIMLTEGDLSIITGGQDDSENKLEMLELRHNDLIQELVKKGFIAGGERIFQTGCCQGAEQLKKKIQEMKAYFSYGILEDNEKMIQLGQLERLKKKYPVMFTFCDAVQMTGCEYRKNNYAKFAECCKRIKKIAGEEDLKLSGTMKKNLNQFLAEYFEICAEDADGMDGNLMDWNGLLLWGQKKLLEKKSNVGSINTVEKVTSYIRENYYQDISVSDVAEWLSITPNYLSTIFKNETKTTFVQYLTEVRMTKARELLVEKDMTVSMVAELVGYRNAGYFTKVFKENTGIYPTEFKKSLNMWEV